MKRSVSFGKLKISGSMFLKGSFKLLVWWYFGWICLNLSIYENVFDCDGFVCWLFSAKSCFYIHNKYMICKHIL